MPTETEQAMERAVIHHRHARRHLQLELTARGNAEFYSKGGSGLRPDEVAARIKACRENIAKYRRLELTALQMLNEALLDAGHKPNDVAEVERHSYSVCRRGVHAVHLGVTPPADEDGVEDHDNHLNVIKVY